MLRVNLFLLPAVLVVVLLKMEAIVFILQVVLHFSYAQVVVVMVTTPVLLEVLMTVGYSMRNFKS